MKLRCDRIAVGVGEGGEAQNLTPDPLAGPYHVPRQLDETLRA
jgi:hypothetical protein